MPSKTRVVILGAGGHGQVVADILLRLAAQTDKVDPIGYLDDAPHLQGRAILGIEVLGTFADISQMSFDGVILGIGDNHARQRVFNLVVRSRMLLTSAIHPNSIISASATLEAGTTVCAGAVINPSCLIGANVILNTACSVDHHNHIGDYAHIAPGAHLGGEVCVGEGALIGIGATVMPRCHIGAWAIVGAGAVVTQDVPDHTMVLGVPARALARTRSMPS